MLTKSIGQLNEEQDCTEGYNIMHLFYLEHVHVQDEINIYILSAARQTLRKLP